MALLALPAYAQPGIKPVFQVRHYTDEHGLPQNSVKSMVPDKHGFVWLATEFGLARFDGFRFQTFRRDTGSLLDSRIIYILPSGKPDEYLGISGNEKLIQVNESAALLPDSFAQHNIFLQGNYVEGNVYSTIGLPNVYYNSDPGKYYWIPIDSSSWYSLTRDSVTLINHHRQSAAFPYRSTHLLNYFTVNDQLYYLNGAHSVLTVQPGKPQPATITGDLLQDPHWLSRKKPLKLFWNAAVKQVFFALDTCLYFVSAPVNGQLHTTLVVSGFDPEQHEIMSVYYNEEAMQLFLGSKTKGLFTARRLHFTVVGSPVGADGNFYAQAVFDSNRVVTPQGYVLGPGTAPQVLPAIEALKIGDRYSMLIARNKSIWIKNAHSLFQFNPDGTRLLHRWNFDSKIAHLYEDDQQRILIGMRGGVIYCLAAGSDQLAVFLTGNWNVSYMHQQGGDTYWIGTANGCYRVHLASHKIDTIPGMEGKYVRSLYQRHNDELWITTYEEGLFVYNKGRLSKMPVDKNKYLLTAHCILEDDKGYFWISTNKGLFQASRQDLLNYANGHQRYVHYLYYEKSLGFRTNEFNGGCQPCGVRLPGGYFSFPSLNGLVWFKPANMNIELPDKPLMVHKVEINQEVFQATDTIHLTAEARRIKIFVTTPYFGNPYNLYMEYALMERGQDTVWLLPGEDRGITLSALPSGQYQLVIRKVNGFGKDNYTYKVLTLVVPPLFYETAWFKMLLVVLLVVALLLYNTFRTRYIRHKNKQLEAHIAARTAELQQALEALQASEQGLRRQTNLQEKLITAIAHDIKSPLKYLTEGAKRLVNRLPKTGQDQEEAQALVDSGARTFYYTDSLLEYIKVQTKHHQVALKQVNLSALVEEKVAFFHPIAQSQGSELLTQLPPEVMIRSNPQLLGVVLHNLIDNAIKVTVDGRVVVSATLEPHQCILHITDTGAGMRPAMVAWSNGDAEQREGIPTGMGLVIVKELLSALHGSLFVKAEEPRGTTVQITLPVPGEQDQ